MSALLSLQDVRVVLGARTVVDGVNLCVNPGDIVALLGPNGAGKTTLMRAALGAAPLANGSVALGGGDPHRLSARERALCAAYLPQRPQSIWPVSVEALVALGRYAHGAAPDRLGAKDQQAVDAALDACSLAPLRARRMDEISGGEKGRAHLARALAQQAPLLLLDEPTAGLDPAQAIAAGEIIAAHAAKGGAVVFSTHDVALAARIAKNVLLLREGLVIAQGALVSALAPEMLEAAYARKGRLERVGEALVAIFD